MQIVSLPAYVSPVPLEPVDLKNSIIIEDEGIEYLVGEAAMAQKPDSTRRFGGTLGRPEYRRLLKALVAATLGAGDHEISKAALAAAMPYIDSFRKGPGSTELNTESEQILMDCISKINFRTKTTHSPLLTCSVKILEKPKVFHETQAVFFAIPNQLKSYVLWQLGHGDWQQAVIMDGQPMREAFVRAEGIAGAVRRLAESLQLTPAEADKAWRMGKAPKKGGMNGQYQDCLKQKELALKLHVNSVIGKLLNANDSYRERTQNIILSGGGAKDDLVFEVLKSEVEADGIYKLHRISDLPVKDERCEDAAMTCVHGLLTQASLALDVGNSFLKGGYVN